MGLQSQLLDVPTDSILIFTVALVGKTVRYLYALLSAVGLFRAPFDSDHQDNRPFYEVVGSGLASLVLLCEQLNLNRECAYPVGSDGVESDCVVCLDRIGEGDRARRLACRHVFHKDCLDGWLDHLNFNCPVCRALLVQDDRAESTHRRVAGDLLAWFPFQ